MPYWNINCLFVKKNDYICTKLKLTRMFKVGSLYAGIGGICQGFINAGANVVWANEYDKNACITYRANFKHIMYEQDIWELDPNTLEKVDILVAGFPCQPFSLAGYRKGFNDERGNHFFRILEYINALDKPKVLLLENVKNLVSHDNGNTFKVIQEALISNGYSVKYKTLNSKDYGNIPQNRERIFIVCFRNDENETNRYNHLFEFPAPIKLETKITDIVCNEKVDDKF